MEKEVSEMTRKAGPVIGTYAGVLWIVSFICMANASVSPGLSLLGFGIGIGAVLTIIVMVMQFRWRVCQGNLSFSRSWMLVLQVFFYGSILLAAGIYVYMRFLDQGTFGAYYEDLLKNPEAKALLDQFAAGNATTSEDLVAQIAGISPINLAISFMESNILLGLFLSLPMTLATRIKLGFPKTTKK